ncbi:MAG: Crp/Fnr family transcriptional regulator [Candidatus Latescibacteria bacterium]|jgi:CRP/FNR family transcriptional regulator, cyclic AMP receptor protein|nr:Crp/Fnr family transcriptional regulator [Candidatus Latescibacterota bacterium]
MVNFLKKIPLFSSLGEKELDAINRVSFTKKFMKDQIILLEDEDGDTLFTITKGKVKVTSFSEHGKEVIFSILYDGDFFGDMSLLDGKPRSASVVAIEDSEVRLIRRTDFIKLLENHPGIALTLLEELTSRLRKADERIESLALLDVTGRMAGILLQLAEEKGDQTPEGVVIKSRPTHQELANMAGTTRETVTRVLKQLEVKDYIVISGKNITIVDPENLKQDLYL